MKLDIIVPVPPSTKRKIQPVLVIAEGLSKALKLPLANCVKTTRETKQLKNVYDYNERIRLLDGLYSVDAAAVAKKSILLFDDLYRSGATVNALAEVLYAQGAHDVFALTITQTRSNR
jgi:competence protein ComFC